MKNFTLNHSTKQIIVSEGCLLTDIVKHFKQMSLNMNEWSIVFSPTFIEIKHPLIERGKNSDPYFNPPPLISM